MVPMVGTSEGGSTEGGRLLLSRLIITGEKT